MEYRVTITISDYGSDPANGELFLSAFTETHPEAGPAVSQNLRTGALSVTFSIDASDLAGVADQASSIFAEGARATGLEPTALIHAEVESVSDEELIDDAAAEPEPVPA